MIAQKIRADEYLEMSKMLFAASMLLKKAYDMVDKDLRDVLKKYGLGGYILEWI